MATTAPVSKALLSTGIEGLDTIMGGGITPYRTYLVEGEPGTGKTTTGLQFLAEGVRNGESVAYITLAETGEELQAVAESHGWTLDGIHLHEVLPTEDLLQAELFLMQHSCHWFCKSKFVASARMLARHQTAHAQLVASVAPATRNAYCALVRPA